MEVNNQTTLNMMAKAPKNDGKKPYVGVLATPNLSTRAENDTVEITNAKAPDDIKRLGNKKRISPIGFMNVLWLGSSAIIAAVAAGDLVKYLRKK